MIQKSIPITPTEEPFESSTICLSFSVDALKDKFLDEIEIFQLVADRMDVARVVLQVSSFYSAALHDQYGWIMDEPKFYLSSWIRMYYDRDQIIQPSLWMERKGMIAETTVVSICILQLGKTLVCCITDVNLFSRRLSLEQMQGATMKEGEKCGRNTWGFDQLGWLEKERGKPSFSRHVLWKSKKHNLQPAWFAEVASTVHLLFLATLVALHFTPVSEWASES